MSNNAIKLTTSFYLPRNLVESLKDIAYRNRVPVSQLVEEALRCQIQKDYLLNGPCPKRKKDQPRGRFI